MHTLLFLEPGHFHAALTLRQAHARVAGEVFVYVSGEGEPGDFLALIERFNGRAESPTRWRPQVIAAADPLACLVTERRGDVVVLAGRNAGKALTIRRLHDAGFHVLADKPWLVEPDDLEHVRASLAGWPLVMEIMTGRHDVAAGVFKRLVDARDVFGEFRRDAPAIELESAHHLEKLVAGAPLRRPWWFFDVRVQGGGAVDIPTHLVDQTQWLLEGRGVAPGARPELIAARAWPTVVPLGAFRRITGEAGFPRELQPLVDPGGLRYLANAELEYRIGPVTARATASWRLSSPPGGGDTQSIVARGTGADVLMERAAHTGYRRRLGLRPHADAERTRRAVADTIAAVQREVPGAGLVPAGGGRYEVTIPPALDTGHETHFARVLHDLLTAIDDARWPGARAERTLAKYTLLAEAAARTRGDTLTTPREESR
jgi:predicted dehydrogenase